MSDDFFRDAIKAARDQADQGVDDGAATRLRIRESLTARNPRRRFTLIAAVIATMFGGTAFAYVAAVNAGWTPPWRAERIEVPPPSTPDPVPPRVAVAVPVDASPIGAIRYEAPVDAALPIEQLAAPVVPTPAVPAAPAVAKTPKRLAPRAHPSPIIAAPVPPAPVEVPAPAPPQVTTASPKPDETGAPASPSAELAAYRHAHELHFRGTDAKAALAAWDTYLATYPRGSLVPEARYDRAVLLVKLGRYAEARTALAPFAAAKVGTYRQREAAEILAAIKER